MTFQHIVLKRKKNDNGTNKIDSRFTVPFTNGKPIGTGNLHLKNGELAETIREITSRLAIYRKLKELGHSDESIFTIYKKSVKEN